MNSQPIVRLSEIAKSYAGVHALKGVDFDIQPGEVHCLVGENGAGKSTLMRILTGATRPSSGTIAIDGKPVTLDPASALRFGIGIVHQELDLVPAMSVAENICLGHEPLLSVGRIDWPLLRQKAQSLLDIFQVRIPITALVRDLPPAQQQLVQIAKAMSHENRVLVLDEPTASLSQNEVERLFVILRRMRKNGLGIIYISHRLEEVKTLGDRVTVLRDGNSVMTRPMEEVSQADIIKAMVGRTLQDQFPRSKRSFGEVALTVQNLTRGNEFQDISFKVKKGEVLALAGIIGAGRSELLETIFGLRRHTTGNLSVFGKAAHVRGPRDAIKLGIGLVPEERRAKGLVLTRSVADNLTFPVLERFGNPFHFNTKSQNTVIDKFVKALGIKTSSNEAAAASLSGGNQQKIVIGKWLAADTKILLLDEPTRGVDVNAKSEIYRLIDELAASGVAIVVASSELPEILGISDRILVLSHGRVTAELETRATDQVEIMHHALSVPALTPEAA